MTQADATICRRAAEAMLAFEEWVVSRECMTGSHFTGPTADEILQHAAGGDLMRWVRLAGVTIDMANIARGCTATAFRIRGQRARGVSS